MSSRKAISRLKTWVKSLPKPVGIMACSDVLGAVVLDACDRSNLKVPDEVAVIGVDNVLSTCESAMTPLTSVAQDIYKMSFESARMLDRLIHSGPTPERRKPLLIAPRNVAVRRSTEAFAFTDTNVSTALKIIHDRRAVGATLHEILEQVPVSRRWLDQRFHALVGHSVSAEIRKARVTHLSDRLLHSDLMIKQIATESGFSSAENMTRFFRDAIGLSPEAYRSHYHNSGRGKAVS